MPPARSFLEPPRVLPDRRAVRRRRGPGRSRVRAPLLARYDLDAVRAAVTPATIAGRPPTSGATTRCCRCVTTRAHGHASARA